MDANLCVLYLEPILDSYDKTYRNILTLSRIPEGPLANKIRRINPEKLSPFQYPPRHCLLTISRDIFFNSSGSCFMEVQDIPDIIGYLETNGYKISENSLFIPSHANRRPIFIFRYSPDL